VEIEIGIAAESDLSDLLILDAECFPPGNLDLEPAPPGEIEAGVIEGSIFIANVNEKAAGMLQYEKLSSNEWGLLALAINASFRGQGIGKALMERFMAELSRSPYLVAVSCITSPNNEPMQGLLESFGFTQVGLLSDHFGPGKHRLRFQLN
jgi:ribosomal protein S18 acetylase RimI-like enzyme